MRQFSYPNSQFTNILGGASIGWKLNVYNTGTTNAASIYSNLAQTTPTANPVIADADGFLASFYWTGTVDVVLTDENDNLIDSANGIQDLVSTINAVVVAGSITLPFGTAAGDGDTITTILPIASDFSDGGVFVVRANTANSGAANTPNLQVNSYASRRIKKIGSSALIANDIVSGMNMILVYNLAQDCYYLINHEATFLNRDGTAAMTGALNMGTQKINGLVAGAARTDALNVAQAQDGSTTYAVAGGSANALTVTLVPAITAYVEGQSVVFSAASNNTAAATINVNSVGAKNLLRKDGSSLKVNDLQADFVYTAIYDGVDFILQDTQVHTSGQCKISIGGGDVILSRYNGYKLSINNVLEDIPAAGVLLPTTSLSPSTLYYVYAYMSGSTMTLEASATASAVNSVNGVRIKSGDATRTLVGMARTSGSTLWSLYKSWFNDDGIISHSYFTADRSTNNTAGFTEINSELRIDFLSWASQKITVTLNGASLFNVTGGDDGYSYFGIAIDGAAVSDNAAGMVGAYGIDNYGDEAWNATSLTLHENTLAEGYHYATVSGLAVTTAGSGGSLYFSGSGTSGRRTSLTVKT